jgi:transposase
VGRILKGRLGWSLQRPRRQAAERDQAAVDQWLTVQWPRIKQRARRRRAWVVFLDESGSSLTPVVRRTWAPRGQPPILVHPYHWQRASMCAAICAQVGGGGARVAFDIRPGSYNTQTLIEVLAELHRFLDGNKVTLVWDNLSAHTSRAMRAWIGSQRSWLVVEYLPPYAPDLNPVETLWSNLKRQELANLATDHLGEVMAAAWRGIERIRQTWWLPYAFARRCGIYLW